MSKKKSKKFKKNKNNRVPTAHSVATASQSKANFSEKITEQDPEESILDDGFDTSEEKDDPYKTDKYYYVQKDVKKILFILTLLLIILFGFYFLSIKSPYLAQISDWFYRVSNIQTQ